MGDLQSLPFPACGNQNNARSEGVVWFVRITSVVLWDFLQLTAYASVIFSWRLINWPEALDIKNWNN